MTATARRTRHIAFGFLLILVAIGDATTAFSHEPKAVQTATLATSHDSGAKGWQPFGPLPPLYKNLGDLSTKVTTANPSAQAYFDQGLRLAYGFNHAAALRSFRAAQKLDSTCALCFWGEAYVLGPNINAAMDPSVLSQALEALGHALRLAHRASAREQGLIAALAKRYSVDRDIPRATLNQAYARAMLGLAAIYPHDDEIAVLTAEALMNLAPWDYWESDGATPKGCAGEAIGLLQGVLARNPDHPAAIHLYIHMVEASTTPERALPYAERLADLMPGAGHLVHMPAHIFARVGRYRDSILTNQAAVAADEAYLDQVEDQARGPGEEVDGDVGELYAAGYYPHNLHFIVTSAQMAGAGEIALAAAGKLTRDVIPDAVAKRLAWVQVIKAAPYFAHAQFSNVESILALPAPEGDFPFVTAMWHYARALAWAQSSNSRALGDEIDALADIGAANDFKAMEAGGVPANDIMRIAYHVMLARLFQSERRYEAAEEQLRAAIVIQDRLPYMEPAYWYYPLRQTLGAVLLQAGRRDEAEALFDALIARDPGNAWARFGQLQARLAKGDYAGVVVAHRALEETWLGGEPRPSLSRL